MSSEIRLDLQNVQIVPSTAIFYKDSNTNEDTVNINAFCNNPKLIILMIIPKRLILAQQDSYDFCNPCRVESILVNAKEKLQYSYLYSMNLMPNRDTRFSILVDSIAFGQVTPITDDMKYILNVVEGPIRQIRSTSRRTGTAIINMQTDVSDTEVHFDENVEHTQDIGHTNDEYNTSNDANAPSLSSAGLYEQAFEEDIIEAEIMAAEFQQETDTDDQIQPPTRRRDKGKQKAVDFRLKRTLSDSSSDETSVYTTNKRFSGVRTSKKFKPITAEDIINLQDTNSQSPTENSSPTSVYSEVATERHLATIAITSPTSAASPTSASPAASSIPGSLIPASPTPASAMPANPTMSSTASPTARPTVQAASATATTDVDVTQHGFRRSRRLYNRPTPDYSQ
ncbi:hypothetical protein [Parasitella parasitica]|uniref:Uncharacterized protein n=1 Tax=Parasitella parasitica TaxID=35722 RepID=A0A0B7MVE4_9FUNG|nr:hypothetical protein [Parasitella parasitica]